MDSLLPVAIPPREASAPLSPTAGRWRAHLLRLVIVLLPLAVGIRRANASLWLFPPDKDSVKERALRADAIPIGSVTGVESFWENSRIVSLVTFQVRDTLKGKLPSQIVLRESGGTVGGIRAEVSGGAAFKGGDESVLFLRNLADDPANPHYAVLDRALGKLDIGRDEAGRETVKVVRPERHRVDTERLADLADEVTRAVGEKRP